MEHALRGWGMIKVCQEDEPRLKHKAFGLDIYENDSRDKEDQMYERPPPAIFHPRQIFGAKTRGHSWDVDMQDLISHQFQKTYLQDIKHGASCQIDAVLGKKQATQLRDPRHVYENRACQLRKSAKTTEVEPTELWRLPRFLRVEPHLSTFRSPGALDRAIKADVYERAGRLGQCGQGVPIPSTRRDMKPPRRRSHSQTEAG